LWAYKAINTLDSMVGYRNARYLRFGWASARMDDLANYVPARITYLLLSLAAFLLYQRGYQALRIGGRDGRKHPSPNAGWAEAAMAGALDVQLGGPSSYGGVLCHKPLLGDPSRPLALNTVRQAIRVMLLTSWLAICLAIPCRVLVVHLRQDQWGDGEQYSIGRTEYSVRTRSIPFPITRSLALTNDTAGV
jgi:adenosylcobinamide-phosphate synthase